MDTRSNGSTAGQSFRGGGGADGSLRREGRSSNIFRKVPMYAELDNFYFKEIVKLIANKQDKHFEEVTISEVVESLRTLDGRDFERIIANVSGNDLKTAFNKRIREIIEKIAKTRSESDNVTNDEIAAHLTGEFIIYVYERIDDY